MSGILIAGATGFLGGALARRLRDRGHDVRGCARQSERGDALARDGIEFVAADVRDPEALDRAVAGMEFVVNLAGLYRLEGRPLSEFRAINGDGAAHLAAACKKHDVRRLVHVSTVGVYGDLKTVPAAEDHPTDVHVDHYQSTKADGERRALEILGDRVVALRPSGVYGPGDTRILSLVRALKKGLSFYPGPCAAAYHPTYIDDALDCFELALEHDGVGGRTYNVAGPRFLSIKEYMEAVARVLGVKTPRFHLPLFPLKVAAHICEKVCRPLRIEPPLFPRRLGFFHRDRAYSIARSRDELGFEPKVDLDVGLPRAIAWFDAEGLL